MRQSAVPRWLFQSSSGQKAGCNPGRMTRQCAATRGFQSSSGQKAGSLRVSILIRPEGRMQLRGGRRAMRFLVSILIRPEGRMQPWPDDKASAATGLPEGQPAHVQHIVSILIRPEGRMQHATLPRLNPLRSAGCNHGGVALWRARFNPHPARRPDATAWEWPSFNPHPARRPDATAAQRWRAKSAHLSFNPHPARRPDATRAHTPR